MPNGFSADFQQIYKSSVSGKIKKRLGSINYKYPGNIRLEMAPPPVKTIFVSNPKESWYYTAPFITGEKGDVIISNSGHKDFVRIFDVLKKGLVDNENYKIIKKKNLVEIIYAKKMQKKLEVSKTVLKFKKLAKQSFKNIEWIEFFYINKKPVKMIFSKLIINPKFSNNHFHFIVPKNTNISAQ